jgi:beta-glucosidase
VVIGTNSEWESEAYDRDTISLPPGTDELVRSILAVTPDAIIVNQSGMPVALPWCDSASTIVQAFFGGNEVGNGIADVLFGNVNPSGKLPVSWGRRIEDWSSHGHFGGDEHTVYEEGIFVGYRWFDRGSNPESAFSFGHGLSYTTFQFR